MLPSLLECTDVVLELRDARLPLTSVSSTQNAHDNQAHDIIVLQCIAESSMTFQFYGAMQTSPSSLYPRPT